jgi:hypothetical protein
MRGSEEATGFDDVLKQEYVFDEIYISEEG